MNKLLLLLLSYILCHSAAFAQKEDYVWVFGNKAGLDFNSGSPLAITTGFGRDYDADEGCASVCDKNGQLLFYTNGSHVWDRNHNLMPTNTPLTGLPSTGTYTATTSTTQGALIVPMMGSATKYYIFSITQFEWVLGRLTYSVVDMSLNGGMGDVVAGEHAILLDSNLTEKMTAVAGDKCNVWLMVRSIVTNDYKAYEITAAGIKRQPVISTCGKMSLLNYAGSVIKFSPDGKKMVAACTAAANGFGGLELYDFDAATGIVSNALILDTGQTKDYYGACFSPNGSKVYGNIYTEVDSGMYQYNLSGPVGSIVASRQKISPLGNLCDMKVGPDGKMYVAGTGHEYLNVVNFPDLAGAACQFVEYGPALAVNTNCNTGLPNVIIKIDKTVHADFNYTIAYGCTADTVTFTNADSTISALKYKWDFNDGTTTTGDSITHVFIKQGNYLVTFYVSKGDCIDSSTKAVKLLHPLQPAFTTGKDTICLHDSIVFSNTSVATNPFYYWRFGDGIFDTAANPSHIYQTPGLHKITLMVTDFIGCIDSASHSIFVEAPGQGHFAVNDATCAGTAVFFNAAFSETKNKSYTWAFGDGTEMSNSNPVSHAYLASGTYYPSLTTRYYACPDNVSRDTVTIVPYPVVNIGPDTSICSPQPTITLSNLIAQPAGNISYWNTGVTSSDLSVNTPGTYWLSVANEQGCVTTDTIEIKRGCYIAIPNAFTPNGDGINDYFFPRELLSGNVTRFHMQIFNRWGVVIFTADNINGRGWDGTFNDTIQPEGTYVYLISASYGNGVEEKYNGNVTLLR